MIPTRSPSPINYSKKYECETNISESRMRPLRDGKQYRNTSKKKWQTTQTTTKRFGTPKNVRFNRGKPKAGEDASTHTRDTRRHRFRMRPLVPSRSFMTWALTWACLVSSLPFLTDSISPFGCQADARPSPPTSASSVCNLGIGEAGVPSTYSQAQLQVEDKSSENDKYCNYDEFWDDIHVIESVENDNITDTMGIKGSLSKHSEFWREIGAYQSVINVIENGYSIPFIQQPPSMFYGNNQSAVRNTDFVTDKIAELLQTKCIVKVPSKPFIVSPLSVAQNRTKKRLILDLSVLNKYVKKDKIKFEDWKIALQYFQKDSFCTKFDLSSGYYHIDIFATLSNLFGIFMGW